MALNDVQFVFQCCHIVWDFLPITEYSFFFLLIAGQYLFSRKDTYLLSESSIDVQVRVHFISPTCGSVQTSKQIREQSLFLYQNSNESILCVGFNF